MSGWARRHEYVAAAVVLVGVLCVWFWPILAGRHLGQTHVLFDFPPWQPQKPPDLNIQSHSGEGDAAFVFQPLAQLAREQIRAGQLPLWNPYVYGGTVLLADMQTALFFPLTWIEFLIPLDVAWGVIAILKLLVAGLGTYAFVRALGVDPGGALVAGVVFMLSAPNVVWLQWPLATVFALFPWLMLVTYRLWRRPDAVAVAYVAAVVALAILAGHPESAALGSLCAGVFLVGLTLFSGGGRRVATAARTLGLWILSHAVGLGVAAVAVIPFLEAFRDSASRTSHFLQGGRGVPAHSVLAFLMPTVYGNGQPHTYAWDPFLSTTAVACYFGLTALMLAAVAAWRGRGRPEVLAMGCMALVAAGIFYQPPLVDRIVRSVPPLDRLVLSRMYVYLAFVGAAGAGAGVTLLNRRRLSGRAVGLVAGGVLIGGLAIYVAEAQTKTLTAPPDVRTDALLRFSAVLLGGAACLLALGRVAHYKAVAVVVVVCAADLAWLQGFNVWLPGTRADPKTAAVAKFLHTRPGPFHVSPVEQQGPPPYPPNTSVRDHLEAVVGYEYPQSQRWAVFSAAVLGQGGPTLERLVTPPVPSAASLPGLRMLNVRYYVAAPDRPSPDPSFRRVYRGRDATVYEDPLALPRAYVVPRSEAVADEDALHVMTSGRWNPRRVALVPPGSRLVRGAGRVRSAHVERVAPDRIRVRVGDGAAGWLVLADAFRSQWLAAVDGRNTTVKATNYAAMGVPVGPGPHIVDFRLSRRSFHAGVAISVAGLAALVALLSAGWSGRLRAFRPVHR